MKPNYNKNNERTNMSKTRRKSYKKTKLQKRLAFIISLALIILISGLGIYIYQRNNNSDIPPENVYASADTENTENPEAESLDTPNHGSDKVAYLTFDDGPSSVVTPQILDILKSYKIKATFFVLGLEAERNPELLKRIYNEGHKIANHSYSHNYKHIYSSVEALLNEINQTNAIIDEALGFYYGNTVFRFPGGSFEKADCFKQSVKEMGFKYVDWNCLGSDAVSGTKTADEILSSTINTSINKNPVTILLHDTNAKQTTADALPAIIEYFINEGYEFKTIDNN